MHNQGEIVLINIPFSNLKSRKKRPVLIISKSEYNNRQDDIIVTAITSNITSKDYTVEFENSDMRQGTLPKKSCIRADKLYSLDKSLIIKNFGVVSDDIVAKTIDMISKVMAKPKIKYNGRSQCLVVRDNKILMVKHKHSENEWNYCLPGGGIEKGETPEQAAIRELQEECLVSGKIIKKVSEYVDSFDNSIYTFQADIGEQNPILGKDPELSENNQILSEVQWLLLNEICERDRAFLWAAGLISGTQFTDELLAWNSDISYPK